MCYSLNVPSNREKEFGLLIAYILPGYISLLGFVEESEIVRSWIGHSAADSPSVGGFLFLTVAAIFVGFVCSGLYELMAKETDCTSSMLFSQVPNSGNEVFTSLRPLRRGGSSQSTFLSNGIRFLPASHQYRKTDRTLSLSNVPLFE